MVPRATSLLTLQPQHKGVLDPLDSLVTTGRWFDRQLVAGQDPRHPVHTITTIHVPTMMLVVAIVLLAGRVRWATPPSPSSS